MNRLSSLFEEDINMQDSIEDLENLTDDSEDIIISAIEERYNEIAANEVHLFTNESSEEVNEDGLTPDEEAQIAAAFLDNELDADDELSNEEIDEFLDDEDF